MAEKNTPKELVQALDIIRGTKGPKLESLDTLEATHVRRVRSIFEDRNIVAIGISEKETEGKATGHLGLTFYVEKKVPKSKIKAGKMIPPVIGVADRTAVFTDVQQIGKITPQVNRRQAPIQSGYSVGNRNETGTLGAIVKKGQKFFLLSNSHVLADSGNGKKGDEIFYPGDADRGSSKLQQVAVLSNIVPFQKTDDFANRVDAALAAVDEAFVAKLDFSIFRAKSPLVTMAPARGMTVAIRGRTSGESEGSVKDVHFSVVIPYPNVGKLGFIDQALCTRYSKGGDSGSIVVDKKSGRIVGLHVAGSPEGSIFSPISEVAKALNFQFANK
jgi:hypothetical protein